MNTFQLDDIFAGWRAAGKIAGMTALLGGQCVPDVDILVDNEVTGITPDRRIALGQPRMAWVSIDSLCHGPHGRPHSYCESREVFECKSPSPRVDANAGLVSSLSRRSSKTGGCCPACRSRGISKYPHGHADSDRRCRKRTSWAS